ncbi:MAG: hypothetical protein KDD60_10695, partial [Bdellovibrionales bacterium]|nr:hypothetical protein [Bdellovibrionales bacterium]
SALQQLSDAALLSRGERLGEYFERLMRIQQEKKTSLDMLFHDSPGFFELSDSRSGYHYIGLSPEYLKKHQSSDSKDSFHFHLLYDLRRYRDFGLLQDLPREHPILIHLVSYSFNDSLDLRRIFTIKEWAKGVSHLPRTALMEILQNFQMDSSSPNSEITHWFQDLVLGTLEICEQLFMKRDRAARPLDTSCLLHGKHFALASEIELSLSEWALALDEEALVRDIEFLPEVAEG